MIRFYNGRALTFAGGVKVADGEVWTDGGVIVYVGPAKTDRPVFEREIDLEGDVVLPSFKDAHTHSAMVISANFGPRTQSLGGGGV